MAVTLPKDDVRYKVGIDVGLNSIGFCAVEVDDDDQPIRLLNSLVFRHDAGVDPSAQKSSLTRKKISGVARRNRRANRETKKRLVALDRLLSEELGWPLPNLEDYPDPYEPWHVRARLLDGYIADDAKRKEMLSIAMRHIARHRGWRNPYMKPASLASLPYPSEFLTNLNQDVSRVIGRKFASDATQGQLVDAFILGSLSLAATPELQVLEESEKDSSKNKPRDIVLSRVRGDKGVIEGKLHQSDNAEEIRRICATQKISQEQVHRLIEAVFKAKDPRKVGAKLVGHDELPGQEKYIRAERAHPAFQKFNIVATLTNLRINEAGSKRRLTPKELQMLTTYLSNVASKDKVTWFDVAEKLKIDRSDLQGTAAAAYDGQAALKYPPIDVTSASIKQSKVKALKDWWKQASEDQRGQLIDYPSNSDRLDTPKTDDELDDLTKLTQSFSKKDLEELEKISLPAGRAAYSVNSLTKLTQLMLEEGIDLHEARKRLFNIGNDWKPAPEPINSPVGNPAVDRVLKQVARWIDAATERWGIPVSVNIEHVRGGLVSEKVVRELIRDNEARHKKNMEVAEATAKRLGLSGRVHRNHTVKYFALRRQNCQCLYCGTPISFETAEMDHIVPRTNGGSNNKRSNLAAVCRTCNASKSNIPFAVWVSSGEAGPRVSLEGTKERVKSLLLTKTDLQKEDDSLVEIYSKKEGEKFKKEIIARLESKKPEEEFDGRSLESVAWMAVELHERILGYYENLVKDAGQKAPQVGVYRGAITAEARKASGFENRVELLGGKGKTRLDRRHHAMDALVIALMNQSVSKLLSWRMQLRDSQRISGMPETWKEFHGFNRDDYRHWEAWIKAMRIAVELFNDALEKDDVHFSENKRLGISLAKAHNDTISSFSPPLLPDGTPDYAEIEKRKKAKNEKSKKGEKTKKQKQKVYGEQRLLGEALSVELINKAETPALWTALTEHPDFDATKGLPADPSRRIVVNGEHLGPKSLLNFFNSDAAAIKVRGGFAGIGDTIHHARIYRIDGKKTTYAMVRVFQTDLRRMKHKDLFTEPLKPSAISMRTASKTIRKAFADGTATQIGWLVEGDEIRIETDRYPSDNIGILLKEYPESASWRVCGFPKPSKVRVKPNLISKEGLDKEYSEPDILEAVKKIVDHPGWIVEINALLEKGMVTVIRRNTLGEERWVSRAHLPVSVDLS